MNNIRRSLMMNQLPSLTVQKCIELGYFSISNSKTNEAYPIKTLKKFPFPIKCIKDFYDCFYKGQYNLNGNLKYYSFELTDSTHISTKEQSKIIDYINNNTITREISTMLFRNFNVPDKDFNLNGCKGQWQYCHDMFKSSTFKNLYLNVDGNISSAYHLFRNLKCNQLEVYQNGKDDGTGHINPYANTGEMYQGANINILPRNITYSQAENNWLFAGLTYSGTEIPNINGVETEEQRISNTANMINVSAGTCYQLSMYLDKVTKIGPVLEVSNTTGYEYLWYRCAIHFTNCTDVRLKGCNNIDYDLRGGKTDAIYFPKIDLESIKYCIENLMDQTEWNWKNKSVNVNIGEECTFVNNNNSLTFYHTTNQSNIFSGNKFNINIPTGYKLVLQGCKKEDNKYYLTEEIIIEGNDIYQEIEFTNIESTNAIFKLAKIDDSVIIPQDLRDDIIEIKIYNSSNETYDSVLIPDTRHTITFSDSVYTVEQFNEYINSEIIQSANNKGWTVYFGDTEITL